MVTSDTKLSKLLSCDKVENRKFCNLYEIREKEEIRKQNNIFDMLPEIEISTSSITIYKSDTNF